MDTNVLTHSIVLNIAQGSIFLIIYSLRVLCTPQNYTPHMPGLQDKPGAYKRLQAIVAFHTLWLSNIAYIYDTYFPFPLGIFLNLFPFLVVPLCYLWKGSCCEGLPLTCNLSKLHPNKTFCILLPPSGPDSFLDQP